MRDADFQRLLFDYDRRCRERGVDPPYDFVAQEEGPRSFTAAADRDRLARYGLFNSGVWRLTEEGHRLAGELENRDVAVFAARLQRRTDASGAGAENQAPVGDYDPFLALGRKKWMKETGIGTMNIPPHADDPFRRLKAAS